MLRNSALLERVPAQGSRDAELPEVLTLKEVAALLRVERHQIAKLIERGLPCHRVGGMRRFLRHEVARSERDCLMAVIPRKTKT